MGHDGESEMAENERIMETLKELTSLTRENVDAIRDLTSAIKSRMFGGGIEDKKNGIWPILFGVGALVFGLMAPLYIMVDGISEDASAIGVRMQLDDIRERQLAVETAKLASSLIEVETQFAIVNDRLSEARLRLEKDEIVVTAQTVKTARLMERIRYLERLEFGSAANDVLPVVPLE